VSAGLTPLIVACLLRTADITRWILSMIIHIVSRPFPTVHTSSFSSLKPSPKLSHFSPLLAMYTGGSQQSHVAFVCRSHRSRSARSVWTPSSSFVGIRKGDSHIRRSHSLTPCSPSPSPGICRLQQRNEERRGSQREKQ
jgi:hypothetical protein